jgi:hypothetical protein
MIVIFKKSDLSIVPRWTDNIKDEWINPFIVESCEVNFRDSISTSLYNAIAVLVEPIVLGTQGLAWDEDNTYSLNDIVLYNDVYYSALGSVLANENPPDMNSNWKENELVNLWANYVKPYLVYACYKSFILWHGKHISQGGIRKHVDNTSFEVDPETLSYLIGDLKNKVSLKYIALINSLTATNYTFAGVKYSLNTNVKQSGQASIKIFAV